MGNGGMCEKYLCAQFLFSVRPTGFHVSDLRQCTYLLLMPASRIGSVKILIPPTPSRPEINAVPIPQ